jgi:hypothetical protein
MAGLLDPSLSRPIVAESETAPQACLQSRLGRSTPLGTSPQGTAKPWIRRRTHEWYRRPDPAPAFVDFVGFVVQHLEILFSCCQLADLRIGQTSGYVARKSVKIRVIRGQEDPAEEPVGSPVFSPTKKSVGLTSADAVRLRSVESLLEEGQGLGVGIGQV